MVAAENTCSPQARAHPDALRVAAALLARDQPPSASCGGGEDPAAVADALATPPSTAMGARRDAIDDIVIVGLAAPTIIADGICARMPDELAFEVSGGTVDWAQRLAGLAKAGESIQHTAAERPPHLADAVAQGARRATWPRWCGRGEVVTVDVTLQNPLAAPLDIDAVELVCTMDVGHDAARRPWSPPPPPMPLLCDMVSSCPIDDAFLAELRQAADTANVATPAWLAERTRIVVPALGARVVRLRCGATRTGTLRVVGVRWRLAGAVWGAAAIARAGPTLRRTRDERARGARAPDASLAIHIVGDLPRVVATLAPADCGGPWRALEGEVVRTHLRLRNVGRARAGSLTVRTERAWLALTNPLDASGKVWRVGDAIKPGASRDVPAHVCAPSGMGAAALHAAVYYEAISGPQAIVAPLAWPAIHDGDPEKDDFAGHARARGATVAAAAPLTRFAPLVVAAIIAPSLCVSTHAHGRVLTVEVANVGSADMFVTDVRAAETCTVGVKILPQERVAVHRVALATPMNALAGTAPVAALFDAAISAARCTHSVAKEARRAAPDAPRTLQAVRRARSRVFDQGAATPGDAAVACGALTIEWTVAAEIGHARVGQHLFIDEGPPATKLEATDLPLFDANNLRLLCALRMRI